MNQLRIMRTVILMVVGAALTGCIYDTSDVGTKAVTSSNNTTPTSDPNKASEPVKVANGGPLGGYIEQFMDANDRTKMARALDGGLGKANRWKNPVSGAEFTVTPMSKASVNGGICRTYSVSMNKSGITDRVSGTACIGEDGVWHAAG